DPQKARDLRLEFPHGPEAPVEGRVRPQEVVHNAQTVQEIERKCPGQALIVYLGEFGEQQAAKHAQFEAGSTREAVRLREPVGSKDRWSSMIRFATTRKFDRLFPRAMVPFPRGERARGEKACPRTRSGG